MKEIKKTLAIFCLLLGITIAIPVEFPNCHNVVTAEAATIKLNKKKSTLYVEETLQLKVTGTKKTVKWSSNKKSVATVNSKGKVTAKKKGTATITAQVDGKKLTCKITVKNLQINKKSATLYIEETLQLKITGTDKTVKWSSSDKSIATVNSKGKVTAKKKGTATITAKIDGKKLTCKITVKKDTNTKKATEFTFELTAGETLTVKNLVFDEDVTISGDFGIIVFENCEFNGDIINTAEQFTRVILPDGTTVNGNCVLKNTTKEATMDTPIPKFISSNTLNIVCEDCIGAFVLDGTEDNIIFNGETYSMADVEFFYDANANELVPYEGQEASVLYVCQWWENGEKILQMFCE